MRLKNIVLKICHITFGAGSIWAPILLLKSYLTFFLLGSNSEKDGMHHTVTKHRGIITLYRHQKAAFAITSRRGPTPKAVKAQIADLPAGSSGNILVELDEVNSCFGFF